MQREGGGRVRKETAGGTACAVPLRSAPQNYAHDEHTAAVT